MTCKTLIDNRFGFPVLLVDVPVRVLRGHQVVDVNAKLLQDTVLAMLSKKPGPLTGAEVHFIRHTLELNLTEFGHLTGVSHAAVSKWEAQGAEPTKMGRGTEFFIRYLAAERLPQTVVQAALPEAASLVQLREAMTVTEEASRNELRVPGCLLEAVA